MRNNKENYVGVKYHVKIPLPVTEIALHNFSGGYCGLSAIEDGKHCLCYLTSSENLKKNQHSIPKMEEKILKLNPALKEIFEQAVFLYHEPLTIAQISFAKKTQIENHVLCIGDSAGMITPLCGNGMSMALHGSKIAAQFISSFLNDQMNRDQMEKAYLKHWNHQFSFRLKTGRFIQRFFGKPKRTTFLIRIMKPFPFMVRALIRKTHGEKF